MSNNHEIELNRDCEAIQIPTGLKTTIPGGTTVIITQSLGGSYTIACDYGLFRISEENAAALGLKPRSLEEKVEKVDEHVDEEEVWAQLRTVYDPEIPVNIVDLGLVYDLNIEPGPGGNSLVSVKMTLTAPGCGMGATIAGDAQQKLLNLPGVEEAVVEIVWDPPWHQSMITEQGRKILGIE